MRIGKIIIQIHNITQTMGWSFAFILIIKSLIENPLEASKDIIKFKPEVYHLYRMLTFA